MLLEETSKVVGSKEEENQAKSYRVVLGLFPQEEFWIVSHTMGEYTTKYFNEWETRLTWQALSRIRGM